MNAQYSTLEVSAMDEHQNRSQTIFQKTVFLVNRWHIYVKEQAVLACQIGINRRGILGIIALYARRTRFGKQPCLLLLSIKTIVVEELWRLRKKTQNYFIVFITDTNWNYKLELLIF